MRKNVLRLILSLGLGLALLIGAGSAVSLAAEQTCVPVEPEASATSQPACECEPVFAIVGCGQCEECDTRVIPLCPPASVPQTPRIAKTPVIDFVQVMNGSVRVVAHVDKPIAYIDVTGTTRLRFERVPFECTITIPGIVATDTVAFQALTIVSEVDTIGADGRTLTEVLCVRINVSIQRLIRCDLQCAPLS